MVAAYWPVPTMQDAGLGPVGHRELDASSRARRTSERPAPPTLVRFLTPREVCEAFWNRRSRSDEVVPSSRARSSDAAHLTRDLVFADDDRLEARAHGEQVLDDLVAGDDADAVAQVVGSTPLAALMVSMVASTATALAAVRGSSTSR